MSRHKKAHGARAATPTPAPGQNQPEQSRPRDRRLHLVTALLLAAEEFPGELGESFPDACAAVGVEPSARGYGLVLAQDELGRRWTQVTDDATGVSSAQSIWHIGLECAYEPPDGTVVAVRPGWPVECVLGLAGLAEPHDPSDTGETVLRPPQRGTPGRRRGMADIIDSELTDMRGRTMEEYIEAERWNAYNMGDTDRRPVPLRLIDMRERVPLDNPAHQVVERALAAAWSRQLPRSRRPGQCAPVRHGRTRLGWCVLPATGGL